MFWSENFRLFSFFSFKFFMKTFRTLFPSIFYHNVSYFFFIFFEFLAQNFCPTSTEFFSEYLYSKLKTKDIFRRKFPIFFSKFLRFSVIKLRICYENFSQKYFFSVSSEMFFVFFPTSLKSPTVFKI